MKRNKLEVFAITWVSISSAVACLGIDLHISTLCDCGLVSFILGVLYIALLKVE